MSTNILLLCGGDGSEHDISLLSAKFIKEQLEKTADFKVVQAIIHNHQFLVDENITGFFDAVGDFVYGENKIKVDCVVPCIHGIPGETGDIQSFLNIRNIPFIGCDAEASRYCFNKITTKLYLDALGIPNTPYAMIPLQNDQYKKVALDFFDKYQDIYVKAASQGSSVGCYHVTNRDDVWDSIVEAFTFSSEVIIEKNIIHRELEVAAYQMDGELKITKPGEIIIPDNLFYTFEEKYSKDSATITTVTPDNLTDDEIRLQVAFCADGTILKENSGWTGRIRVKKKYKKEALRKLFASTGLDYKETPDKDCSIFWYKPSFVNKKMNECLSKCNLHQAQIIADEVIKWDGDRDCVFRTTHKDEADFIQFIFMAVYGTSSHFSIDDRVGETFSENYTRKSICYEVRRGKYKYSTPFRTSGSSIANLTIEDYEDNDPWMYCINVPSHNLVLRYNNRVFITGNCFSGKDSSKVDRSGAYMARYVAKNLVASGVCDKCMIQVAYIIVTAI